MKRYSLIITGVLIAVFFAGTALYAQENNKPWEEVRPGGRKPGMEPPPREGGPKPPRPDRLIEAKEWLEQAKKYRLEIEELEKELEPIREEMRETFSKAQQASNQKEKEEYRAQLGKLVEKQDDLEIKIAEKQLEFAKENFNIALDRMVQAEVELRETKRRIQLRGRIIRHRFPGPREREGDEPPPPRMKRDEQ